MIISEDGSGIAGANSYVSVAQADAYHALRMNEAWATASPEKKDAACVLATDYIEANYLPASPRNTTTQGLQWPVGGETGVPPQVVAAASILALHALSGPLQGIAERGIKSTTTALDGALSSAIVYDDPTGNDPFQHITALLSPVASRNGSESGVISMGRLSR